MIPKVIHYCWFGGKKLPKEVKKCIRSWKKMCPDYKIVRWDESNFDVSENDFIQNAYNCKAWAFVSDYARLKIIYDNGGIYLDTDVELLKSLDNLLENEAYFAIQQKGNYINTGLGFGAQKNNKVLKEMMNCYNIKFEEKNKNSFTCPIINTKIIKNYCNYSNESKITEFDNIKIFPSKYFDPLSPGTNKSLLCNETISIHHYSASWTTKKSRLKRKIINIIGQEKIIKIKKVLKK